MSAYVGFRLNWTFKIYADHVPTLLAVILGMDGVYSYRNDAWYSICSPDITDIDLDLAWSALVHPEYALIGQARFATLVETKQHQYVSTIHLCKYSAAQLH